MYIVRPDVGAATDKVPLSVPTLHVDIRSQVIRVDKANRDSPFVLIVKNLPLPVSNEVNRVARFDLD